MTNVLSAVFILNFIVVSLAAPQLGIMGGDDADIKDLPYVAAMFIDWQNGFSGYGFTATILNENTLVTTGICTNIDLDEAIVTLGYGSEKLKNLVFVNVTKLIKHEKLDFKGHYDIGLIKVDPPMVFGSNAQPVKLPALHAPTPVGQVGVIAAWGGTSHSANPNTLQRLNMTVTTDEFCEESLKDSEFNVIPEVQFCARNEESTKENPKVEALGDLGAALTIDGVLYGVTSYGHQDGVENGLPTAFTKVSEFVDWIQAHI